MGVAAVWRKSGAPDERRGRPARVTQRWTSLVSAEAVWKGAEGAVGVRKISRHGVKGRLSRSYATIACPTSSDSGRRRSRGGF